MACIGVLCANNRRGSALELGGISRAWTRIEGHRLTGYAATATAAAAAALD